MNKLASLLEVILNKPEQNQEAVLHLSNFVYSL